MQKHFNKLTLYIFVTFKTCILNFVCCRPTAEYDSYVDERGHRPRLGYHAKRAEVSPS